MHVNNIKKADRLLDRLMKAEEIIRQLNFINGGAVHNHIPTDVFAFVDTKLAAMGLTSLMIEASSDIKKELESLGIEL